MSGSITVATWNINSVRLRINQVTRLLRTKAPDILCLQETKVPDDKFPLKPFHNLGYTNIALNGQKGHHGVAIVSRIPFSHHWKEFFCGKTDARHVAVTLADKTLHNFYIPAGGDIPDPEENERFAHKLSFLKETAAWFKEGGGASANEMILVGDLNVAPGENDVWSHKQLLKVVSHTPVEVDLLGHLQASRDWVDLTRAQIPEPEKIYTWWSYRARDWRKSNRGRRLDHIWATPDLAAKARSIDVIEVTRGWKQPSDHVPVIAEFTV